MCFEQDDYNLPLLLFLKYFGLKPYALIKDPTYVHAGGTMVLFKIICLVILIY